MDCDSLEGGFVVDGANISEALVSEGVGFLGLTEQRHVGIEFLSGRFVPVVGVAVRNDHSVVGEINVGQRNKRIPILIRRGEELRNCRVVCHRRHLALRREHRIHEERRVTDVQEDSRVTNQLNTRTSRCHTRPYEILRDGIYFDIFQPSKSSTCSLLDELNVLGVEIHVEIHVERIGGELLCQPRFRSVETVLERRP